MASRQAKLLAAAVVGTAVAAAGPGTAVGTAAAPVVGTVVGTTVAAGRLDLVLVAAFHRRSVLGLAVCGSSRRSPQCSILAQCLRVHPLPIYHQAPSGKID